MIPVEIIDMNESKVLAVGHVHETSLPICPDGVLRISNLCWNTMTESSKKDFLLKFNAR